MNHHASIKLRLKKNDQSMRVMKHENQRVVLYMKSFESVTDFVRQDIRACVSMIRMSQGTNCNTHALVEKTHGRYQFTVMVHKEGERDVNGRRKRLNYGSSDFAYSAYSLVSDHVS